MYIITSWFLTAAVKEVSYVHFIPYLRSLVAGFQSGAFAVIFD